jgi:hypothetical protein
MLARSGHGAVLLLLILGLGAPAPLRAAGEKSLEAPPLVAPAMVLRTSTNKDKSGRFHPPWGSVVVWRDLPTPARVGDEVTVLPLRPDLPSQELRITKVTLQQGADDIPTTWLVDIDASNPEFFGARPDRGRAEETPFDVVIIYPAVPQARLLRPSPRRWDLPKEAGCSRRTLWAAVDLNSDATPDAAVFRYCCNMPAAPWGAAKCEFNCERTYARRKDGSWTMVRETSDY